MEPIRSPSGPRVLLPSEIELIEAVGLTEAEYWEFVEKAETYNGERGEEYELVPDVQNGPLVPALISLAIGAIVSVVGAALTPKPKAPKVKESIGNLKVGGGNGPNKFVSTTGFDSVQDIARLGETIPLVFSRRGVRVNTQLVWSQIVGHKTSSELRALFVLSKGPFEEVPDAVPEIEGLAVGDTTINNYTLRKVAAYFKPNGGRISDRYHRIFGSQKEYLSDYAGHDGAFDIYWDTYAPNFPYPGFYQPFFSSTRTPSTSQQFGAYSPMPNGTDFKLTYELNIQGDDATKDLKEEQRGRNNLVVYDRFSPYMAMDGLLNPEIGFRSEYNGLVAAGARGDVQGWDVVQFTIKGDIEPDNEERYRSNKIDPVNNGTEALRTDADVNIEEGELYLLGDVTLGVCAWSSTDAPWRLKMDKSYLFRVSEPGNIQLSNPDFPGREPSKRTGDAKPWMQYALQRAAVGVYTNSRPCTATEFVIKSQVWRRLDGHPDIASHPDPALIEKYEENNGSLTLGVLNKYIRRLSFFMLEVRPKGGDADWIDITGDKYFFVEGNSPVDVYNYIRVNQPVSVVSSTVAFNLEYEYRFRPVSGIGALRKFRGGDAATAGAHFRKLQYGSMESYSMNGYLVTFGGEETWVTRAYLANKELFRKQEGQRVGDKEGGAVTGLVTSTGSNIFGDLRFEEPQPEIPPTYDWREVGLRAQSPRDRVEKQINHYPPHRTDWAAYWDGIQVGGGQLARMQDEPPRMFVGWDGNIYDWVSPYPGNVEGQTQIRNGVPYTIASRAIRRYSYVMVDPGRPATPGYKPDKIDYFIANTINVSGEGEGLQVYVEVYYNGKGYAYIIFPEASNPGTGYKTGDTVLITGSDKYPTVDHPYLVGATVTATPIIITEPDGTDDDAKGFEEIRNFSPYDAALDIVPFSNNMSASNYNGPEHTIAAVNEKVSQPEVTYPGLALVGLHINSSKEWANFSNFSVYVKKGIQGENLLYNGNPLFGKQFQAINRLPDIVYGLMTNVLWGAGDYIGVSQVDKEAFITSTGFCESNGFYWDGVIADKINFRQWVFEQAQYCLLDATIVGGRFALYPAVPFDKAGGKILNNAKPEISALFTDGNMRNMEVTFLAPEDRELFRANVLWRYETPNGFPEVRQVQMEFIETNLADPQETFDLTSFCTSQEHAIKFARYALCVRKYVDHTIKFETTPQAAMSLRPGAYFRVVSKATHTRYSRYSNGSIDPRGHVTTAEPLDDGTYQIIYWRAGQTEVNNGTMRVSGGVVSDNALHNCLFSIQHSDEEARVYKVESIDYGDDGLIEIVGSVQPLTNIGSLKILDWNDAYFRMRLN